MARNNKLYPALIFVLTALVISTLSFYLSKNLNIFASTGSSFEICDNGLDDNGDGRVDGCWDPGNDYSIKGKTFNVSNVSQLTAAGQQAQAGDGILIDSGTDKNNPKVYNQPLVMSNSGTDDKPIIIKGVGAGKPVIRVGGGNVGHIEPKSNTIIDNIKTDGIQTSTPAGHGQGGYGIYLKAENNVRNVLINNYIGQQHEKAIRAEGVTKASGGIADRLIVRNSLLKNNEWATYIGTDSESDPIEFKNTLWENVEADTSVYDEWNTDGFLIEGRDSYHVFKRCKVHGFHDGGFDIKPHILIENTVSYDNKYIDSQGRVRAGEGFKIWRDGIIRNCIAYDNGYANYLFGGYLPNWKMINNVSYNGRVIFEDRPGLSDSSLSSRTITISHNILVNSQITDEIQDVTGISALKYADHNIFYGTQPSEIGTNGKIADPKFKNAPSKDFHLVKGSPAIDTGSATLLTAMSKYDFDNNTRKAGLAVDVGPYEYGGSGFSSVTPTATVTAANTTTVPTSTRVVSATATEITTDPSSSLSFVEVGPKVIQAGRRLAFYVQVKGNPTQVRTISKPEGSTFKDMRFTWTPDLNKSGSYTVQFQAKDNQQRLATMNVDIKVLKSVSFLETRWINYENRENEPTVSFQVCRRSTYSDKYTEVFTFSDGSDYLQINESDRSACSNFYEHDYDSGTHVLSLYLCENSNGELKNCFPTRAVIIKKP